jgi:hypothetical protein
MDKRTHRVTPGNKADPRCQHAWALGCAVGTKLITFQARFNHLGLVAVVALEYEGKADADVVLCNVTVDCLPADARITEHGRARLEAARLARQLHG